MGDQLQTPQDLEQAFLKWNKFIYSYIYLRIQNRETAEDLSQEVFMNSWRSRETFNPKKASIKSWLFTIAINEIRDYIKKLSNKKTTNLEEIKNVLPDNKEYIPEQIAKIENIQLINSKLRLLSEKNLELIILRFQQDLSVKEISEILNIEYSATKVALYRAVRTLQELCKEN